MTSRKVSAELQAKPAPPVSAAWLERVALHYLDRYAASTEMLRRVLTRRVETRCRALEEDAAAHAGLVEEAVARASRAGLVDDARFAAARLATLRRRGASTRGAAARLAQKGVAREVVAAALAAETDDAPPEADAERAAAEAYARRRRLGPNRPADTREAHRARDLAAMARAGFSYGIAKAVIGAGEDVER